MADHLSLRSTWQADVAREGVARVTLGLAIVAFTFGPAVIVVAFSPVLI